MISIIFFAIAVLLWDGIKKRLRGPRIPTVSLRSPKIEKAKCGCRIHDGHVIEKCAAHKVMVEL